MIAPAGALATAVVARSALPAFTVSDLVLSDRRDEPVLTLCAQLAGGSGGVPRLVQVLLAGQDFAYAASEAANLMVQHAAQLYEAGEPAGKEANMAKLLASEAAWQAAEACMQTHGGFGFAEEYDVERKFRETRLYQIAPISTNLILAYLAEHVLGLPRSY
jgi:hypothetical protein